MIFRLFYFQGNEETGKLVDLRRILKVRTNNIMEPMDITESIDSNQSVMIVDYGSGTALDYDESPANTTNDTDVLAANMTEAFCKVKDGS